MEIGRIEVTRLKPWEENPRRNDHAVDAVAESIQQFGFNVPILCDQDLRIVAGHVRWKAAERLGLDRVPVIQLHMTETQRRAFSVADNKTADIADWDYPMLADILKELESEEFDVLSLGFSEAELHALLQPVEDFDFTQFDEDLLSVEDRSHVLVRVKVPTESKGDILSAIKHHAATYGIAEGDAAVLAGRVFAYLLGVSTWTSR